jgi:hypothetical protein
MTEQFPVSTTNPEAPINTSETLETPPSPEEIKGLQARFDAVVNSPLYDKFEHNPTFSTEVDPETNEVVLRRIHAFGQRGEGSMDYDLYDDKITVVHKSDNMNEPPLSVDDDPDRQRAFMEAMDYDVARAQQKIEAQQTEREAQARKRYGPKLGSLVLRRIGIKGPYNKRMQQIEDYRTGVTKFL